MVLVEARRRHTNPHVPQHIQEAASTTRILTPGVVLKTHQHPVHHLRQRPPVLTPHRPLPPQHQLLPAMEQWMRPRQLRAHQRHLAETRKLQHGEVTMMTDPVMKTRPAHDVFVEDERLRRGIPHECKQAGWDYLINLGLIICC